MFQQKKKGEKEMVFKLFQTNLFPETIKIGYSTQIEYVMTLVQPQCLLKIFTTCPIAM